MVKHKEKIMKLLTIFLSLAFLPVPEAVAYSAGNMVVSSTAYAICNSSPADTNGNGPFITKPFQLDIIPPSSGIQFYRNGIIFLSHAKVDEKVPEKHLSFGALKTFMTLVQDTVPGPYMPFLISSDFIFPSEATTFSNDFNTMYLSLIPPGAGKEQIFKAVYSSSGWDIEEEPLNFCDANFIMTHPSLSPDGTFIVFSSDLTGTAGGLDLYVAKREGEKWGNPENLGRDINTTGNELFAYLDSNNNLYFSSDGLPGEGGYDIFVCRYNGSTWEKPHNLSKTINTTYDEVAFTVSRTDYRTAFYTSRKSNGKNRCDLISVTLKPPYPGTDESGLSKQLMALAGATEPTSATSPVQTVHQTETVTEPVKPEAKTKPAENIAAAKTPETNNPATTTKKEPQVTQPKPEAAKTASVDKQDAVIYRVQILANTKPVGSKNITIAGTTYKSFEYLYKGGYRTTVGEFGTLAGALKLQNVCRQNGYKEAFVVAFRNNVRDTDPTLFK